MEFWKIIWEWDFFLKKIKFKNWNFEELFENGSFKKLNLKIGILKNYLKTEILKIKFENWNFGKLFENGIFKRSNF